MAGRFDPNKAQNAVEIEKQYGPPSFVEDLRLFTYWIWVDLLYGLLNKLRLDDEIYEDTMATFPELAEPPHDKLTKLDEDWMKSPDGKERWRQFINRYEKKVQDYNFGSLIRTDAQEEYGERNTIFVTRIQFYAIEISRNRLGLNDKAHELAKAEAAKEKAEKEKEKAQAEKKKKESKK
ncbi:duf757 domain-containing protein [Moniliophthora roreri]|nr:duf757 domain-containing protein [Moniliophthora roreri]